MYAAKTGKYKVPRKGSPEYDAVKKLMGASAPKEAPAGEGTKKGEVRKTARKAFEGTKQEELKEMKEKPKRRRAAPKKAVEEVDAQPALKAVAADHKERKPRRGHVGKGSDGLLGVGATERAVAKSKNPEVLLDNATNVHEPIAPPAAEAGDLAELKKAVARVRKPKSLPKLVEPERVVNEKPFSFSDLKKHLGLM